MYHNILIAADGAGPSERAARQGLEMAKAIGARVTVVTVSDEFPTSSGSLFPRPEDLQRYEASAASSARMLLDRIAGEAAAMGVQCTVRHVADKAPAEGILATCAAEGCDLIVMSTHGRRGMDRLLLGSQAARIVTLSKVTVLVVK